MRMKRTVAVVLLLLLALAGCSRPVVNLHEPLAIAWNGKELTGATFYARTFPAATVHYAVPSSPEDAEWVGQYAMKFFETAAKEERCCQGRVDLWLLPPGAAWPKELPRPMGGLRTVAPGALVIQRIPTAQELARAGDLLQNWMGAHLQLALTEPAGSPVLAVDWLYQGMGAVLAAEPAQFPANVWSNLRLPEEEILTRLQQNATDYTYYQAATALAALLADRFGLRWTTTYPRTPEQLTPEAALQWATGAIDTEEAIAKMRTRMGFMRSALPRYGGGKPWVRSAADMSPIRLAPKLPTLPPGPGPEPNRSPHRYAIRARLEPDTRTVTGELTLQWQNGEGIPVDTLYFNLWPNAEQFAADGGAITIRGVSVNGQAASYTARGLDLAVPLGSPVETGGQAEVRIAFTTRLAGAQFRVRPEATRFQLAHWYPTLAVLDDRGWNLTPLPEAFGRPYAEHAAYHVELDLPAGYALAASGRRTASEEQGGRQVYRYEAEALQEFTATGGPGLTETVHQAGNHTLRLVAADPLWHEPTARAAADALALFEQQFGALPQAEIALLEGSGTTWLPGLLHLAPLADNDQKKAAWQSNLSAQLADLWFGQAVGSDRWGEPWLSEAFALYAVRHAQRQSGTEPAPLHLRDVPEPATTASTSEYLRYGGFSEGVGVRGAQALEALEQQLGPAAFGALLRSWTADFRYRTATTADFVARAEAAAGTSLAPFWQQWRIDPALRAPYEPLMPLGKVTLP